MRGKPHRAVIVGHSLSPLSGLLLESFCKIAHSREDLELAAIGDSRKLSGLALAGERVVGFLDPLARKAFNRKDYTSWPRARSFHRLARKYGVPYLVPPHFDLNHPDFISRLRNEIKADLIFSFFCPQRFRKPLLDSFSTAVNYHDGLLPAYRGLRATGWSLYNGETATGFAFHHMNEELDEGPILLSDSIPVTPGVSCRELSLRKAQLACRRLPEVVTMTLQGDEGRRQKGEASYFSGKDFRRITTISNPSSLEYSELTRRLRAFELLQMQLAGKHYEVTSLETVSTNASRLSFTTADGVDCRPNRFRYLPGWAYPFYSLLKRPHV